MRVALHSILRAGHEADYERDHATIPADLAASFARLGIEDWTIWRSGADLFHLVECHDFDGAMAALADDPANERWQAFIGVHVERFLPGGEPAGLPEVWSLGQQRGDS